MSRVVKQNTMTLVFEVEASVQEAEEGHAARTIELPADLMSIVEKGLVLDWHQDVDIRDVGLLQQGQASGGGLADRDRSWRNCSPGWLY